MRHYVIVRTKRGVVNAKFENIEFKAIKQIYSRYLTIQEILKNLLTVTIYYVEINNISIFFIFGIVFTSIHGGRGAPLPPPEELQTTSTVPLENLSLSPDDFIILADSTPVPIESAHVSMNVPCQIAAADGNNITTSTTTTTTTTTTTLIPLKNRLPISR